MTFPAELDGAKVLYYTPAGDYGTLEYTTGGVAARFAYLAICQYPVGDGCYLFCCNEKQEVETDSLWASVEECMAMAAGRCGETVTWLER